MQWVVTPQASREIDAYMIDTLGIPGLVLMEQAATAVAEAVLSLGCRTAMVICGGGNNGGDGFAAARILRTRGVAVRVGAIKRELPTDAAANLEFFARTDAVTYLDAENLDAFFAQDCDCIVDAIFGIGLSRAPEGIFRQMIEAINAKACPVVAVDMPSGVNGETGQVQGTAVRADVTVTFQYAKTGHFIFPGRAYTGQLTVAPIGIDAGAKLPELFHMNEFSMLPRRVDGNKGTYGRIHIVAGSRGMSGAAVLSARAALAVGAGITAGYSCGYTVDVLQRTVPEALAVPLGTGEDHLENPDFAAVAASCTAFVLGPGIGVHRELEGFIRQAAGSSVPKVLDADALNLISQMEDVAFGANTVLTPHPKEFSRLCGSSVVDILADPLQAALHFARERECVLLLKGATTIVTDGRQAVFVTAGAPSMAKGGSGDVLAGAIGGLLAQGMPVFDAACAGAYICGRAGEAACAHKGEYAPSAQDTIANIRL